MEISKIFSKQVSLALFGAFWVCLHFGVLQCLKDKGEKGVCKNGHGLLPLGTSKDNGWGCDGRNEGGCLSGITGFHQTKGMNRFQCEQCDFDYCEKCYILRTGAKLCLKGHPLLPLGSKMKTYCCAPKTCVCFNCNLGNTNVSFFVPHFKITSHHRNNSPKPIARHHTRQWLAL